MSATSILTARVPADQADAVRDGLKTVLAALGLTDAPVDVETEPTSGNVLADVREILSNVGVDPGTVSRLVFHVEEWDNGYYLTDSPSIEWRSGADTADLDFDLSGAFGDVASDLDEMHGGPRGRYDAAIVDLTADTVEPDANVLALDVL